jgi:hypothetical protein
LILRLGAVEQAAPDDRRNAFRVRYLANNYDSVIFQRAEAFRAPREDY